MDTGGHCSRCGAGGGSDSARQLRSWGLVLPAMGAFLFPLLLAVLGTVVAGNDGAAQLLGAVLGLGLGICAMLAVNWIFHLTGKENS
jgi:hypothetical protein